jgi:hypothetical protein
LVYTNEGENITFWENIIYSEKGAAKEDKTRKNNKR